MKKKRQWRSSIRQHWMILNPATGKIEPSRRGPGSAYGLTFKPKSLAKGESFYRKLLRVMHENNIVGLNTKTASEIARLYNDKYPDKRTSSVIGQYLDRFFAWNFMLYDPVDPVDKRRGLWALQQDIDVEDGQALLARVEASKAKLLGLSE